MRGRNESKINYIMRDAADQDCRIDFPPFFNIVSKYYEPLRTLFHGEVSVLLSSIAERLLHEKDERQPEVEKLHAELEQFENYIKKLYQCVTSSIKEESERLETQYNLSNQPGWQENEALRNQFLGNFQLHLHQLNTKELPQGLQEFNNWFVGWADELNKDHENNPLVQRDFVLQAWKALVELEWVCKYSAPTCSLFFSDKIELTGMREIGLNSELLDIYDSKKIKHLVNTGQINNLYETSALFPSLYFNKPPGDSSDLNNPPRKVRGGLSWDIRLYLIAEGCVTPESMPAKHRANLEQQTSAISTACAKENISQEVTSAVFKPELHMADALLEILNGLENKTQHNKDLAELVTELRKNTVMFEQGALTYSVYKENCTKLLAEPKYQSALYVEQYNTHCLWNAINEAFRAFFNCVDVLITRFTRLPTMGETSNPAAQFLLGRPFFFSPSAPSEAGEKFNEFKSKLDALEQLINNNELRSSV